MPLKQLSGLLDHQGKYSIMKILLCDDQAVIRDGLEMLLNLEKDFQVVGAAQDGAEAVDLAAQKQPDLILMDLKMPIMNGIEATREIRTKFPNIKILVLTTYDDDEWVFDAIRAGASGYLLKDTPRQKIVEAIRGINGWRCRRAQALVVPATRLSRV